MGLSVSFKHIVPAKAPSEAFYCTNIIVHILSPLSDSWLFLNQREGKPFIVSLKIDENRYKQNISTDPYFWCYSYAIFTTKF